MVACFENVWLVHDSFVTIPVGIYKVWNMFKVNNKDTCSGVFIINFEYVSHLVLVFLLLTLNM